MIIKCISYTCKFSKKNNTFDNMTHSYDSEDKLIVAVDCIIFGFDAKEGLKILLIRRRFEPKKGHWSLMGGFLKKNETLDEAAYRVLKKLTGLNQLHLEQLEAYSEVDRDPVERTISTAYSALINTNKYDEALLEQYAAQWFSVNKIPKLIFDHDQMVERAIRRLRSKATTQPIGLELLPEKFTMKQLQTLYETILGETLDKRNFIKKILSIDVLIKLEEKDMTSSKKGSYLYKFDLKKYVDKSKVNFFFNSIKF